jgi:hypothetical protein
VFRIQIRIDFGRLDPVLFLLNTVFSFLFLQVAGGAAKVAKKDELPEKINGKETTDKVEEKADEPAVKNDVAENTVAEKAVVSESEPMETTGEEADKPVEQGQEKSAGTGGEEDATEEEYDTAEETATADEAAPEVVPEVSAAVAAEEENMEEESAEEEEETKAASEVPKDDDESTTPAAESAAEEDEAAADLMDVAVSTPSGRGSRGGRSRGRARGRRGAK